MLTTSNYALKKPEGTDVVNIDDFNFNADTIDKTLKSLNDGKAPSGYGLGTAAIDISGKDLSNIVSTGFYRGSGVTNAPSNQWFYFIAMQHSDNNWNWQYAITFGTNTDANKIYSRVKANGTWTSWKQLATTDMIPLSLPANGGNAATANKISTARKINGVAFDGSGDITITANPNAHTHDDRYYTESEINTKVDALNNAINGKASTSHNHTLASLSEKSYNSLTDKPTSLPANGGNSDTVGGKHASDFAPINNPSFTGSVAMAGSLTVNGGIRVPGAIYTANQAIPSSVLGGFVEYVGSGNGAFTLPTPVGSSGQTLTIWNNTGYILTLSTPAGGFYGTGLAGGTTLNVNENQSITLVSDGYNWIAVGGSQLGSSNVVRALNGGYKIQSGTVATGATSGGGVNATVTFPTVFKNAPLVFITPQDGVNTSQLALSSSSAFDYSVYGTSATGFTLLSNQTTSIGYTYNWIAIGY